MTSKRNKPQGATGAIRIGPEGADWMVIEFPNDKAEREQLIANLFVKGFDGYVASQSEPSLAPFGPPQQNAEDDLDFTIESSQGVKLMELAEFAPLAVHGPKFSDAPLSIDPKEKADLAYELIHEKSAHQGGTDRFLVLYKTEYGFWLDPLAIERLRRMLAAKPPNFDRVYFVSPHDLENASVSEIFPGKPHHIFGERTDEQLGQGMYQTPHPSEFTRGISREWTQEIGINGQRITATFRADISGLGTVRPKKGI